MKEPGFPHSRAGNVGAYLDGVTSLYPRVVTAGGGADNVYQDGEDIDRIAKKLPGSALILTAVRLVMASGEQAVISQRIQDKDEGEGYATYGEQPEDVTVDANDDGSAIVTVLKVPVDLAGAKQYFRHGVRVNLTASGTDTAAIASTATLGGLESLPAD